MQRGSALHAPYPGPAHVLNGRLVDEVLKRNIVTHVLKVKFVETEELAGLSVISVATEFDKFLPELSNVLFWNSDSC